MFHHRDIHLKRDNVVYKTLNNVINWCLLDLNRILSELNKNYQDVNANKSEAFLRQLTNAQNLWVVTILCRS